MKMNYPMLPKEFYVGIDVDHSLQGRIRTENDYISFFDSCFWQIVEAKSKVMGCWVRGRPLLPTPRMVSFSFSIIDYKSLTYVGGSRPITVFRHD